MKKIIFYIFISFSISSVNSIEYSTGINDKTGFMGFFSKSWITDKPYGESYITVGGLAIIGSLGYGQKYYFSKHKFLSSYFSWTGFGYYILSMSENSDAHGSLGLSANLGLDFIPIKWKGYQLKTQFGLLASYDPIIGEGLVIPGESGPSFLMPSVNIQLRAQK